MGLNKLRSQKLIRQVCLITINLKGNKMNLTEELARFKAIVNEGFDDSDIKPHSADADVMKSLQDFVQAWCKGEDDKRRVSANIIRAEREIKWLEDKIAELEKLLEKKPSKIKEIKTLQHQMRERELHLAFDPWYGAEIKQVSESYAARLK